MKVLHGMVEVAGQGIYSVRGLKENGVDAQLAVWTQNPNGYQVDLDVGIKGSFKNPINIIKVVAFALKAAFKYDCFHFHFAKSLIPGNLDLFLLKKLKKKMFFEFHGSEVRGMINDVDYKYFKPREKDPVQYKRLMKIAKYADGFIIHDEELRPHLPDCDVPVYMVPLRLDIDQFVPKYPDPEEKAPLIVHAPSHRGNKGTETILQEIATLAEGSYRLELVENKTQKEAFEIYREADIIIDQIGGGTYGVFSIEGMALGKPVITYITEYMRTTFPELMPIISGEPGTMREKLEILIKDGNLRNTLGKRGREYAEFYHDYKKNGHILKEIYEGKE